MISDAGPLPGAPDPWQSSSEPALRPGPPFVMTEMIAAEPALAARIVRRLAAPDGAAAALAVALRETAAQRQPILVTGCGTSEHAAMGIVEILRDAFRSIGLAADLRTDQAFEASLEMQERGLVIGVSHEGGTRMTNAALERARAGGLRTTLVTVSDRSPGAALADIVVTTDEQDQGWCHTVGYLSPLVAAAAIAAHLTGTALDPEAIRGHLAVCAGAAAIEATEHMAAALADRRPIIVVASGADRPAGRELVLKIEEGTHLAAAYRDLETLLHGHLAATDTGTGLVLMLTDPRETQARAERAHGVLQAARRIGIRSAAILSPVAAARLPDELTPGGRVVVGEWAGGLPSVATLLGTVTPLQLLVERIARVLGVDPDTIRREDAAYREAAAAAD